MEKLHISEEKDGGKGLNFTRVRKQYVRESIIICTLKSSTPKEKHCEMMVIPLSMQSPAS